MSVFIDGEAATSTFGALFSAVLADDRFLGVLRESGTSLLFDQIDPACRVFVSAEGVRTGSDAPDHATLVLRTSCDTAHALWSGEITFPAAVTTGRLKIFGKVSKVLEVMPAFVPVFERYPAIAAAAGPAA